MGRAPHGVPEGGDADLAALLARPFRLVRPPVPRVPFVFASPHSGRRYPASLVARSRLDAVTLRRSEDAFVDTLFESVSALGAPFLAAEFPRAFVDVNRGPGELDPAMFDGRLTVAVDAPGPRVTAGLGVIPRIVRDGAEIYAGKLKPEEARQRLDGLYRPYHAALAALVAETEARFGTCVLVDCHSMPSALSVPDIVLGDRYGASAAPALVRRTQDAFQAQGFSVARNVPYAGGQTTLQYGRANAASHALQIEVNRGLYLDEERILRKAGFADVQQRLENALAELVTIDPVLLSDDQDRAAAAE
jgi:N-formylglutamate deformylase